MVFIEKKAREVDMGDIVWPAGIRPGRVRTISHIHVGTQTTLVNFGSVDDRGGTYMGDYLPWATVRLWSGPYQEALAQWETEQSTLIQQILAIKAHAMNAVQTATESDWPGILGDALDEIEALCDAQKKEDIDARDPTVPDDQPERDQGRPRD